MSRLDARAKEQHGNVGVVTVRRSVVSPGGHRGPVGFQHHYQVSGSLGIKAIAERGAYGVRLYGVIQQLGASVDTSDVLVAAQDGGGCGFHFRRVRLGRQV